MKYALTVLWTLMICACLNPESDLLKGKPMPSFNLLMMDGKTHLNTNNIPSGKPTILMYFNPDCHFCKAEIDDIIANHQSFTNLNFYMVSDYPYGEINKYYAKLEGMKNKNILMAQDYASFFQGYFKPNSVPYLAIYNKNKILKQVLIGKVAISTLNQVINSNLIAQ